MNNIDYITYLSKIEVQIERLLLQILDNDPNRLLRAEDILVSLCLARNYIKEKIQENGVKYES